MDTAASAFTPPRRPSQWFFVPLLFAIGLLLACNLLSSSEEAAAPGASQAAAPTADPVELEYWSTIKESDHPEDFASYLERYPQGVFADLATTRLQRLEAGDDGAADDGAVQGASTAPNAVPRDGANGAPPSATGAPSEGAPSEAAPPGSSSALEGPPGGSGYSRPPGGDFGGAYRDQRANTVRNAIYSALGGYSDRRLHLAPDIPRFKLDNVANLHGLDSSRVILLYDDGSSGGGKSGFCLTDRRIYWRFIAGDNPYYLDYEDIQRVRVDQTSFTVNDYPVPTALAADPAAAARRFADILEEIRYRLQGR